MPISRENLIVSLSARRNFSRPSRRLGARRWFPSQGPHPPGRRVRLGRYLWEKCFRSVHSNDGLLLALIISQFIEGELIVRSSFIARGYLSKASAAFSTDHDGRTTFATGDLYRRDSQSLVWIGRKDDYISLASGEQLDARAIEHILDEHAAVARSCVVGDNFLNGTSSHICAIIEPSDQTSKNDSTILRALASANRELPPSMRIAWSRVLVLQDGEKLPLTTKGVLFRKRMGELYRSRLDGRASETVTQSFSATDVHNFVANTIAEALGMPRSLLEDNRDCTLAEVGT